MQADIALIIGSPADTVPRAWPGLNEILIAHDGLTAPAHAPGTLVPGFYPGAAAVLGRCRLRHPAALRHGNGRRHLPSGHDLARAGAKTLEGRLCAALAPA